MYCNKCGCKISVGDKHCPDCGSPAGKIEYCGGFWGLLDENELPEGVSIKGKRDTKPVYEEKQEQISEPVQERKPARGDMDPEKRAQRSARKTNGILWIICIILVIFAMIQTFRISGLKRNLAAGTAAMATLETGESENGTVAVAANGQTQPENAEPDAANGDSAVTVSAPETDETIDPDETEPVPGGLGDEDETEPPVVLETEANN